MVRDPDTAFRDFHLTLRRYLAGRLGNPEDVEDVLQEVFLRVTRNRAALATAKDPLAWLYTVTKSAMIDHLRRQKKHASSTASEEIEAIPGIPTDAPSNEFGVCVTPLVENLPSKYRDAIRFVDIEGGRQTDFAAETGLGISTIKSHVQRGRQQLKSAILDCCAVERDALNNITELVPGDCGPDCC